MIYRSRFDVLTFPVRSTANRCHLTFFILDEQNGHVQGAAIPIENELIALTVGPPVHAAGNGSCNQLIDET
ncbi:NAD-specific glutamate dehydrogenase [Echinococcus multilocularis]|uniref:NAD-specific glutamate dehydrogenase n=1 Tax=Echinococcus multilocularis TaxID=6211 RepID=A0A087VWV7_ECHMU|nr:NAD-specific glutamate dehydrogenase [Echinococcus multilocularis]